MTANLLSKYIEIMWKSFLCIASMMIFFSLLACVVAPAIAAFAPSADNTQESCCEGCGQKEKASESDPCSTVDCPLLLCIAVELVEPIAPHLLIQEAVASYNTFPQSPIPDPFVPSIFHPPQVI